VTSRSLRGARAAAAGLALGCSATLDFDVDRLPARDAGAEATVRADVITAGDVAAACDVACAEGMVCARGACACPAGTYDCGPGPQPRCRACCESAHCDDGNGCTNDRCGNDGRCVNAGCEGNRVCCDNTRCCVGSCGGRCV
jgi:hypothetical protein